MNIFLRKFATAAFTLGLLMVAPLALAQTAAISPSAATYDPAGGTTTFTVTLNYPGVASAIGFSVVAPWGWTFGAVGGTNVPTVAPGAGDTGEFDFVWSSIPASPVRFTFTTTCAAGLSGNQVFQLPTGIFRVNGSATTVVIANVVLTAYTPPGGGSTSSTSSSTSTTSTSSTSTSSTSTTSTSTSSTSITSTSTTSTSSTTSSSSTTSTIPPTATRSGGGGAPSGWFYGALALLWLFRRRRGKIITSPAPACG